MKKFGVGGDDGLTRWNIDHNPGQEVSGMKMGSPPSPPAARAGDLVSGGGTAAWA